MRSKLGHYQNFIDPKNRRAITIGIFIMILGIFLIIFHDLFSQLLLDFLLLPSYLLAGSYSIDVFPQSNAKSDTLTFTIKETGLSYNNIYIQIFKLNSSSGFRWLVDNVKINKAKEASSNKTLLGENFGGIWYLNVNTSSLQPGNYLLHAEITDDSVKNSTLIPIIKHADKLFYIAPKSTNYSLNSTQS